MWLHKLALVALLVGAALAQQAEQEDLAAGSAAAGTAAGNDSVRRLRFRRPRPKVVSVSDEEGVAGGRPVPLRAAPAGVSVDQIAKDEPSSSNTAELLAAAFQEPAAAAGAEQEDRFVRPRPLPKQQADPLQSLLATATGEKEAAAAAPAPAAPAVPAPSPSPAPRPPAPRPTAAPAVAADDSAAEPLVGRTRAPPGVPRRAPDSAHAADDEGASPAGSHRPVVKTEAVHIGTSERYSHQNEDGSFTFGYTSEDGSFREETRGVDCITKGKYGYIDPDGKKREFSYVSGLPCDIGKEGELEGDAALQSVDGAKNEGNGIDPVDPAERFRTEQAVQLNDDEIPDSARPRPNVQRGQGVPRERPAAFNSLLQTAGQNPESLSPTPLPNAARPRPTPAAAAAPAAAPKRPAAAAVPAGAFDFDKEVEGFNLNRPALTFEQQQQQQKQPAQVGPNFSSELVFNPETGTFQTELRQNIQGQGEVRVSNQNAPAGRRPATAATAAPATFAATPVPATTAARPAFNSFAQQPQQPRPTPAGAIAPGGAIKFDGLSFPDPATVRVPPPAAPVQPQQAQPAAAASLATPAPQRFAPTPASAPLAPTPTPANSAFFQQSQSPFPQGAPSAPTAAAGTRVTPAGAAFSSQPTQAPFASPAVQFGFQPVGQQQQQQQQQARPFTAFAAGTPPQQQQGATSPQPFQPFGQQPQQFQQQQAARPQQPQFQQAQPQQFQQQPQQPGQPQQFRPQQPFQGAQPPQFQQQQQAQQQPQPQFQQQQLNPQDPRFQQFGRPAPAGAPQQAQPQQPQQGFSVFNPSNLRGQ